MKADRYGTPSEQHRYRLGWLSATAADAAAIARDHRCDDCMHREWSETARTPRPRCGYGGPTSARATCNRWTARPAPMGPDIADGIVTALHHAGLRRWGAE
jgi:hypothetical protein